MSFSERSERLKPIIESIEQEYREAATWLPFQATAIKAVFSKDELDSLAAFLTEMEQATDDNKRRAKLIEKGVAYAGPAVKLLKLAKVI